MKYSIYFVLLIFLLNGCVHRGHTLDLKQNTTERYTEQSHHAKTDMKDVSSSAHIVQEESFFNFDDISKNNISGALILIIGLILVL